MTAPRELVLVAQRLGDLGRPSAFVGGMVRGLLITDPAVVAVRHTKAVDLVVEVSGRGDYYALSERLRERGFAESMDPEAPICRFVVEGVLVDVMPTAPDILGFSNPWYSEAVKTATTVTVDGTDVRVIDAVHFLATKLEAWRSRGQGDLWHHDLEDVIALIDGRPELEEEVRSAAPEARGFISRALGELLAREDFIDAIPGHLAPDEASQARAELVRQRLSNLGRPVGGQIHRSRSD